MEDSVKYRIVGASVLLFFAAVFMLFCAHHARRPSHIGNLADFMGPQSQRITQQRVNAEQTLAHNKKHSAPVILHIKDTTEPTHQPTTTVAIKPTNNHNPRLLKNLVASKSHESHPLTLNMTQQTLPQSTPVDFENTHKIDMAFQHTPISAMKQPVLMSTPPKAATSGLVPRSFSVGGTQTRTHHKTKQQAHHTTKHKHAIKHHKSAPHKHAKAKPQHTYASAHTTPMVTQEEVIIIPAMTQGPQARIVKTMQTVSTVHAQVATHRQHKTTKPTHATHRATHTHLALYKPQHKSYYIQMGSFLVVGNANTLLNKLKQKGYKSFVKPKTYANGKTIYRVYVGPTEQIVQAKQWQSQLFSTVRLKGLLISRQSAQKTA